MKKPVILDAGDGPFKLSRHHLDNLENDAKPKHHVPAYVLNDTIHHPVSVSVQSNGRTEVIGEEVVAIVSATPNHPTVVTSYRPKKRIISPTE